MFYIGIESGSDIILKKVTKGATGINVGKIGRDQVEDYARRKGMALEDAMRWLRPILGFE